MFLGFPAFGRVDNEGNVVGRLIYDTSLMGGKYKMGIKGGGQVRFFFEILKCRKMKLSNKYT